MLSDPDYSEAAVRAALIIFRSPELVKALLRKAGLSSPAREVSPKSAKAAVPLWNRRALVEQYGNEQSERVGKTIDNLLRRGLLEIISTEAVHKAKLSPFILQNILREQVPYDNKLLIWNISLYDRLTLAQLRSFACVIGIEKVLYRHELGPAHIKRLLRLPDANSLIEYVHTTIMPLIGAKDADKS